MSRELRTLYAEAAIEHGRLRDARWVWNRPRRLRHLEVEMDNLREAMGMPRVYGRRVTPA